MFFLFCPVPISRCNFCFLWWLIIKIYLFFISLCLAFFFQVTIFCLFHLVFLVHVRDFISCHVIFDGQFVVKWIGHSECINWVCWLWTSSLSSPGERCREPQHLLSLNFSCWTGQLPQRWNFRPLALEGCRYSGSPVGKRVGFSECVWDHLISLFWVLNCSWLSPSLSVSRE